MMGIDHLLLACRLAATRQLGEKALLRAVDALGVAGDVPRAHAGLSWDTRHLREQDGAALLVISSCAYPAGTTNRLSGTVRAVRNPDLRMGTGLREFSRNPRDDAGARGARFRATAPARRRPVPKVAVSSRGCRVYVFSDALAPSVVFDPRFSKSLRRGGFTGL